MAKTNYYEYDFYKALGQILRAKRIAKGMTLEDAALSLGKTIKTVQRYETGERKITVQAIKDLCKIYGADPDEVMMQAQGQTSSEPELPKSEVDELLERAFSGRPEMRMLFSVAENATKEDIEKAIRIIEALKGEDF